MTHHRPQASFRVRHLRVLLAGIACLFAFGCRSSLSTHPRMSPDDSLRVIADRLASVNTIQSIATVDLDQSDGSSVRLDAALVGKWPGMLRLRAWKLSRAVFDVTLRDGELWLLAPEQQTEEHAADLLRVAQGIRRACVLLSSEFYESALVDEERTTQDQLVVIGRIEGEPIRCVIDRETLTPRRFETTDEDRDHSLSIELRDYHMIDGIAWPRTWEIAHPRGVAAIRLREIELQGELPPRAFDPPRRATRSP